MSHLHDELLGFERSKMLPKHGKITCRTCFDDEEDKITELHVNWRVSTFVNNIEITTVVLKETELNYGY